MWRSPAEQPLRKKYLCNGLDIATHGEDTFVNARDDFADASFDTGLLTEVSNIFAALSDDDAGILCADKGAEGECFLGRRRA